MRQYFLRKWIRELVLEIEQAKKHHNLAKLIELKHLQDDLLKLLDRVIR